MVVQQLGTTNTFVPLHGSTEAFSDIPATMQALAVKRSNSSSAASDAFSPHTSNPSSADEGTRHSTILQLPPNLGAATPLAPAISGFDFGYEPGLNAAAESSPPSNPSSMGQPFYDGRPGHPSSAIKDHREKKTQYYEDQFAYKDGWESSATDRVRSESPVIFELRTNVIVSLSK
jgi:hypothetical protein